MIGRRQRVRARAGVVASLILFCIVGLRSTRAQAALTGNEGIFTIAGAERRTIQQLERNSSNALSRRALATETGFWTQGGMVLTAGGSILVADSVGHRVLRFSPKGTASFFAGTGKKGFAGEGGAATRARLVGPFDLTLTVDGAVLITDSKDDRVRRVDTAGRIHTVAGNGMRDFQVNGLGGPATEARLAAPSSVAAGPDGSFVFHDSGKVGAFQVDRGGGLSRGPSGFPQPRILNDLVSTWDGGFLVVDGERHRVVRYYPDGRTEVAAGGGLGLDHDFAGDGGPAAQARMYDPGGAALAPDGSYYVADTRNWRIRRVTPDGIIRTIGGHDPGRGRRNGPSRGDGGRARDAFLRFPGQMAIAEDGGLLFEEGRQVRFIAPPNTRRLALAIRGHEGFRERDIGRLRRWRLRRGSRLRLRYVLTRAARVRLEIYRRRFRGRGESRREVLKWVATVRRAGRKGRNRITWNGGAGREGRARRVVGPGTYIARLHAATTDGQRTAQRVEVRVTGRG